MNKIQFTLSGFSAAYLILAANIAVAEYLPFEPEMVQIEGGKFQMGCVSGKYCRPDELPVRNVSIKPFEMGKYEVTFDQWDECVKQKGCTFNARKLWGGGKQPVVSMSWEDAQEYIIWLNEKTGKKYRLPSEAEWEYAARAGTQTPFSTGECISNDHANYKGDFAWDDSGCPVTGKNLKQAVEVGSFPANAFGLFDMHGNLSELVQDCYHRNYEGAPVDGSAWETDCTKRGDDVERVMRGSSWIYIQENLRSARRERLGEKHRPQWTHGLGFRVARTL
ncbi:MAG: formylglycine-generating enzyme family protein [Thiolinea sp.]